MAMSDKGELLISVLKTDLLASYAIRRNQIKTFIKLANDHRCFEATLSPSVGDVIGQINSALSGKTSRLDALLVLQSVITQCTSEVFGQNWEYWLKTLFQILHTDDSRSVCHLSCQLLDLLLFHLKNSEFGHQFISGSSAAVLTDLMHRLKDKEEFRHTVYIQTFIILAKHYPGPCGPHAGKMENYLIPMFDSSHEDLQKMAAKGFSLLPKCGGGGSLGVKHAEFWSNAVLKLLAGLHQVLDQLFAELETGTRLPNRPAVSLLQFAEVDAVEPCRTNTLSVRFRGMCYALEQLLSSEFPAVVKVPLVSILELFERTLAMTPKFLLAKPTTQRLHVAAIVPSLHEHVLFVLQALCRSVGHELLPFSEVINGWFVRALNWSWRASSGLPSVQGKQFVSLRCAVYSSLVLWMQSLNCSCGTELQAGNIIRHAIADSMPSTDAFNLQVSSKLRQAEIVRSFTSSKKQKTSNHMANELDSMTAHQKINPTEGIDLCLKSLEVLKNLLLYCGSSLSSENHQAIQTLCGLPVTYFHKRSDADILLPYNNASCRKLLYQLLLSVLMSSFSQRFSPDSTIVRSFSLGLNDRNIEVRHCCAEALAFAENVLHPRLPVFVTNTSSRITGDTFTTSSQLIASSAEVPLKTAGFSVCSSYLSGTSESVSDTTVSGYNGNGKNKISCLKPAVETLLPSVQSTEASAVCKALWSHSKISSTIHNSILSSSGSQPSLSAGDLSIQTTFKQSVATCPPVVRRNQTNDDDDASLAGHSSDHIGHRCAFEPMNRSKIASTSFDQMPDHSDNCNHPAGSLSSTTTGLKRSHETDVEWDENEIEPEVVELMVQSFNYSGST